MPKKQAPSPTPPALASQTQTPPQGQAGAAATIASPPVAVSSPSVEAGKAALAKAPADQAAIAKAPSPPSSPPKAQPKAPPLAAAPAATTVAMPANAKLVLWVASEAVPLASTGGLGDVVGALPGVLRDMGWDVRLCLPYYRHQIKQPVSAPLFHFDLPLAEPLGVDVRELINPPAAVPTYLIDCPMLFDRVGLYVDANGPFVDNPFRFGVFQLAAQQLAARLEPTPAIIHSHDWHAALLPALVRLPGPTSDKLANVRTLFTIHNLQYQGDSDRGIIEALRLPPQMWDPNWAEHYDRFIPLKAALMTADRITTVSPTYAEELRSQVRGMGLDGVIRSRGTDMRGLLNGIDEVSWNPAVDPALAVHFSAAEVQGRVECTKALRAELGLPDRPDRPLVGFIGRLVTDKGVDLILDALPDLLDLDVQVVVLGSGDAALEARLRAAEATYAARGFRTVIKFDAKLARRMYAAFDMLLVPSRLEPCGLVQLYALRYGAVPVVNGVGGLRDTVREDENGFVFNEASAVALTDAVTRAVRVWDDQIAWTALQVKGLQQDWSWKNAAVPYDALYREVLNTPIRRAFTAAPVAAPVMAVAQTTAPVTAGAAIPGAPAPAAADVKPSTPVVPAPAPRPETTAFRLMVQGPRSLFAYWSAEAQGPFDLVVEERPSGVMYTAAADLPAKGERWLGALPDQAYRAFLRDRAGRVVALSNAVVTPLQEPPPPAAEHPEWLEAAVEVGVFNDDGEGRRWSAVFKGAPAWTKTKDGSVEPSWPEDGHGVPATGPVLDGNGRPLPHVGASEALHAPAHSRRDINLVNVSMHPRDGHSTALASSAGVARLGSGSGRTR